ncbi:ribosome maturation factor RimP [Corynebacterium sp. TAE3-ERU12]|uniref:ribosome maturation factor RimP n=1 Tax=Corynebacterium sp. TAE3-ERU12 TaxID=2849491 RepID=UPI001C447BA1|nr:ribosome maturation factor RimP [Corynebacterium sp. TAE3-ERU12]MBV7295242.1 ribosome maturation factor RimP [Corynebacterium sp. TAE3-ERU12]
MAYPSAETVTSIVERPAAARELDIEDVKIVRAGAKSQVTVLVDGETAPDLDTLEALTEEISAALDAAEASGKAEFGSQPYRLEVSTPGVDHPLTRPRHWRRNQGRLARVEVAGEDFTLARIGALSDDETRVILIPTVARGTKKGQGKKAPEPTAIAVPLEKLNQAVVEVEFTPAPETEAHLAGLDFDAAVD